jgi:hypothetical protein
MKYLAFKNFKGIRIITGYVSEVTEPGYDLKIINFNHMQKTGTGIKRVSDVCNAAST